MTAHQQELIGGYDLMRTTEHWDQRVENLRHDLAALQQQLDDAIRNADACHKALQLCQELMDVPNPAYGIHGHIRLDALMDCETQLEAIALIARRTRGVLNVANASKMLFDTHKWRAKDPTSLRRSLQNQLGMKDQWEKDEDGKGMYRLLDYEPEETPSFADSCSTDDGDASLITFMGNDKTSPDFGRITV